MEFRDKYKERFENFIVEKFDLSLDDVWSIPSREGLVLTDGVHVFKCLTFLNEQSFLIELGLDAGGLSPELDKVHEGLLETRQSIFHSFFILKGLSESIGKYHPLRIISFDVYLSDDLIILRMPFVNISDYPGGYENEMVCMLRELKDMGWISVDMDPKNIKVVEGDPPRLLLLDIGYFYVPAYEELFDTMCRRAYVTLNFAGRSDIRSLLRKVNVDPTFSYLDDSEYHRHEFSRFYAAVMDGEP